MKNKKDCKWFKEKKKKKDLDAMKFAKDSLLLAGGVAVLGAGLSLLD